ncbi:MAG: DUF1735 domain-containing protein [Paludibacter sp.]
MKKILGLIALIFTMTSCYDNYVEDFKYDAVYFTYQYDVRTFVVGEGMSFDFGVGLGGVMTNTKQRIVEYKIDSTLITPAVLTTMKASSLTYIKDATSSLTALSLLPSRYYSLTDGNKFIIEKGQNTGRVTIRPDSAAFLSDPKSLNPNYVLPLVITSADADSIKQLKKATIIGVKYENMLFGNYWHGGVTIRYTAANVVKDTLKYYTAIPSPESKIWVLKTAAPFELTTNGYANVTGTKQELKLTLNGGNITVGRSTGSTFAYSDNGNSTFNRAKLLQNRKIVLNYKYVDASGYTCYATDTLTFRNRIRDGVNEWQDENPSHYN